jgi:hypothetical protein
MKNIILSVAVVCFLTTGCSVFVSKTQTINAACSESDAVLQVNGGEIYTGQATLLARRDRVFSYACLKQGYYPAHKSVSYSMSPTGIADFIGSLFIYLPIVGIFTPGAWSLDETNVTINMVKY